MRHAPIPHSPTLRLLTVVLPLGYGLMLVVGTGCMDGDGARMPGYGDDGGDDDGDEGNSDDDGDGDGDGDSGNDDPIEIPAENMIDDLEDGDGEIEQRQGRMGSWYTYNDGTAGGTQSPPASSFQPTEGGPASSTYCASTTGAGFAEWGAGLGFDLNNRSDECNENLQAQPYDASSFEGIAFMAKGEHRIRVKLQVGAVIPVGSGGSCAADCEDAHGKSFVLENEWKQYRLPFDEATQEGWGADAPFDPSDLFGVQFEVNHNVDFDYSIDEVGFYGGEGPGGGGADDNTGPADRPVLAGFRASRYGIQPFPEPDYWTYVADEMASRFATGTPAGIWIVGEARAGGDCHLTFPSAGSYPNVDFAGSDLNEAALSDFDSNGAQVFLQVEPGNADIGTLIDLVLERYADHPSVIGFGVDVEWYAPGDSDDGLGKAVSDVEAASWLGQVRAHDASYELMLKHFDPYRMPPCERDGLYFVNDSQGAAQDVILDEFRTWADMFAPTDVGFQIGYPADRGWWADFEDPPSDFGNLMVNDIRNTAGVFWVDFTVREVF